MGLTTDHDSENPMRDTQPAPPLHDELTKPDNRVPALPSPTELLDAVGEFSREMRDSLQEIRTAVEDSNNSLTQKLDALERQFSRRLQILTNEVSRVSQQQVSINERLNTLENRVERLELNARRPSEAP